MAYLTMSIYAQLCLYVFVSVVICLILLVCLWLWMCCFFVFFFHTLSFATSCFCSMLFLSLVLLMFVVVVAVVLVLVVLSLHPATLLRPRASAACSSALAGCIATSAWESPRWDKAFVRALKSSRFFKLSRLCRLLRWGVFIVVKSLACWWSHGKLGQIANLWDFFTLVSLKTSWNIFFPLSFVPEAPARCRSPRRKGLENEAKLWQMQPVSIQSQVT